MFYTSKSSILILLDSIESRPSHCNIVMISKNPYLSEQIGTLWLNIGKPTIGIYHILIKDITNTNLSRPS